MKYFKKCATKTAMWLLSGFLTAMSSPVIPAMAGQATEDNTLSIDVRFKEPKTLLPDTDYNKVQIQKIMDVSVYVNGEKDALSSVEYYVLPSETFNKLEDKSELSVKEAAKLVTRELKEDEAYYLLPATFVAYHTFEKSNTQTEEGQSGDEEIKEDQTEDVQQKEAVQKSKESKKEDTAKNKEENTEKKETEKETKMVSEDILFCVTKTADELADMYKADTWYQVTENGVMWKYTLNADGNINKLYTENKDLGGYIISDTLMIPSTVNGLLVTGIGSGTEKPFIPTGADGYVEINIPDTLQVIGDYSFYRNRANCDITIPSTVLEIGEKAFFSSYVKSLSVFGKASIGELAFANCHFLNRVYINGSTNIGRRAFDGGAYGSNLEVLSITGTPVLGDYSFCNNEMIKDTRIPEGTKVSDTAFFITGEESINGEKTQNDNGS